MGRRPKNIQEPCCYHITHRCQERRFLLKFEKDRLNYINRLRDATHKFKIDVLDYVITSNHVHLLLWTKNARNISLAMHFLQGNSSKDYNQRKGREGSFWQNRYHPTIIQAGAHLSRCFFYIDMNMVRAKVATHPSEWKCAGYHELCGKRKRYTIINRERVLQCLEIRSMDQFNSWYLNAIESEVSKSYHCRQAMWSEALAIGEKDWLEKLSLNPNNSKILPAGKYPDSASNFNFRVSEDKAIYQLIGSTRDKNELWKKL